MKQSEMEAIGLLAGKQNARVTIDDDGLKIVMWKGYGDTERRIDQKISYHDLFLTHMGPVYLVEDRLDLMCAKLKEM